MLTAFIIIDAAIGFAVLIYIALLFLTAPASIDEARSKKLFELTERCFAHKGLYTPDQTVPENTLSSFKAALDRGYGIDCDVQRTWDGQAVCFCDSHMRKACGIDERMVSFNYEHLKQLKLFGTEEHMPLLSEALELIDGNAPVIVEIKTPAGLRGVSTTCSAIYGVLKDYKGLYCVASFDPHVLQWFRKNAPEVIRMQASMPYFDWRESERNVLRCLYMSRLFCNVRSRPHIIAYSIGKRNFGLELAIKGNIPLVLFTADKRHMHRELLEKCDSLIFEGYLPPARTRGKEADEPAEAME